MQLFGFLVLSIIIGAGVGYWCLKRAFYLGYDDFAYNLTTPFTWLACGFYETLTSGAVFVSVFLLNSLINYLTGGLSDHLVSDVFLSVFIAQILIFAMIVEGARRRRRYYALVVSLRRSYRRFPRRSLIRPPFRVLYSLW